MNQNRVRLGIPFSNALLGAKLVKSPRQFGFSGRVEDPIIVELPAGLEIGGQGGRFFWVSVKTARAERS
jgi:hypothetical protein